MHITLGSSDFKKFRENKGYYIDKSMLIKELVDDGTEVLLLPRPRRFGKTLNVSMIRYFFDIERDTRDLFKGLLIEKEEAIMERINTHPVIYLSFRGIKANNWEECYGSIKSLIAELYRQNYNLLKDELDKFELGTYEDLIVKKAEIEEYKRSIKNMMIYLKRYYGKKVILLIDEYDVPMQSGWLHGYYDEVVSFMQVFQTEALKDNEDLEKGVLSGILRVAKESIFSGLNNIKVNSLIKENRYNRYFGFTEEEVEKILKDGRLKEKKEEVKRWYNGYNFGGITLYNPWSILNYVQDKRIEPYWINTSGNDIIKELINQISYDYKEKLEKLVQGESLTNVKINDHIVYNEIKQTEDSIWSFMVLSGYLKIDEITNNAENICKISIPNKEVRQIYKEQIIEYFEKKVKKSDVVLGMIEGLKEDNMKQFTKNFKEAVYTTFSYMDADSREGERFYNGFSLGIAVNLKDDYHVKSNKEVGYGRYDISMEPFDKTKTGIIIEIKEAQNKEDLEKEADKALTQIEKKEYYAELMERGIKNIRKIAIAFKGKWCQVKTNKI